jgi:hypothetical protein
LLTGCAGLLHIQDGIAASLVKGRRTSSTACRSHALVFTSHKHHVQTPLRTPLPTDIWATNEINARVKVISDLSTADSKHEVKSGNPPMPAAAESQRLNEPLSMPRCALLRTPRSLTVPVRWEKQAHQTAQELAYLVFRLAGTRSYGPAITWQPSVGCLPGIGQVALPVAL